MRILDAFKTEKDLAFEQIKPFLGKGYMIHFSTGRPINVGVQGVRHDPMLTLNTKFTDEETRFFFILDFFLSKEDVDLFVENRLGKVESILNSINDVLENYDFVKEIVRVQPKPVEPTEQPSGQ